MGSGSWSPSDWTTYSSSVKSKPTDKIFTSTHGIKDTLDPKGVNVRESRDSVDNPQSTAIIVALDVTGSMGMIAETLAREGLGVLFSEILDRKPVTNPHLMFMAIGDAACDQAPLQVSQFEADNRIVDQLTDIWLEGHGGGNDTESYDFPWYFAAQHTSIDCFEKRGKKGYLFTVGDEESPNGLTADQLARFVGDKVQGDFSPEELLVMAQRMYHVFHVIVEEGSHARSYPKEVLSSWQKLLGQKVLRLSDHTKLSEVIISAIQVVEGADKKAVAASWSGSTSLVVKRAINDLAEDQLVVTSGTIRF